MAGAASHSVGTLGRRGRALRPATVLPVVAGVVGAALICTRIGGAQVTEVASNLATLLAALFAGASCARRGARRSRAERRGWWLLAAASLSWAGGQAMWTWYEVVLRLPAPFPSLADLGFLAMVPLALAGMTALVTARDGAVRTLLDGAIIAGSLFYISWALVLGPVYRAGSASVLEGVVSLAYPVGDVAMASMVFILLAGAGQGRRLPLGVLGAGALALAVADSGFAYLMQAGTYQTGNVIDAGWVLGFVLIGVSAAIPAHPPAANVLPAPVWMALPYVPLMAALTASVCLRALLGQVDALLYAVEVTLVVLVVTRQLVGMRDNALLARRLAATVGELRISEQQLRHLAFHDPLTGLANRALFRDRTEQALARQDRHGGLLAVLYVDLDGFKHVNDAFGHAAGDALLTTIAERLRGCVRAEDTLARLGGDEFAVLVEGVATNSDVDMLAARIVSAVAQPVAAGEQDATVGASVGVALREPAGASAGTLLRRADLAMYAAKAAGRGQHVTYRPALHSVVA